MTLNGRTLSIIRRFPHFYAPDDPNSPFHQLLEVFGQTLNQVEADLMQVMRSHFVDTAENVGSEGYTSAQKGDLDRIFTLYLERLGGTSQLRKVNQVLQASDLKQIPEFVQELLHADDTLASYLWKKLPLGTQRILNRYQVSNSRFLSDLRVPISQVLTLLATFPLDEIARTVPLSQHTKQLLQTYKPSKASRTELLKRLPEELRIALVIKLLTAGDAVTLFLRQHFSPTTEQLLAAYDGQNPVPEGLTAAIASDFNQILPDPFLYKAFQDRGLQITLAMQLRELKDLSITDQPLTNSQIAIARAIAPRLSLQAKEQVQDETSNAAQVQRLLVAELKPLLQKISFCQQLQAIAAPAVSDSPVSIRPPWSERSLRWILQATQRAFIELFTPSGLSFFPPLDIQPFVVPYPTGENLERLNRRLLEATFLLELPRSHTPTIAELSEKLVDAFNEKVLKDPNFYRDNQSTFTQFSLSPETQNLITELEESQQTTSEAKITRLNRLLLETVYPAYIEKSYVPYRERLKRLINVLKNGASTQEGIVDIVAANLGINRDRSSSIQPWEQLLFSLSPALESALNRFIASGELQQAFAAQGIMLSFGATVVMKSEQQWIVTDVGKGEVYTIQKQAGGFGVYRQLIRVIEYLPETEVKTFTVHPKPSVEATNQSLLTQPLTFQLTNPNLVPAIPTIEIRVRDVRSPEQKTQELQPLTNLRLVNRTTQEFIQYLGVIKCDEVLLFLADGSVLVNGVMVKNPENALVGKIPAMPLESSEWFVEAFIGYSEATFDQTLFDFSLFEAVRLDPITTEQASSYVLEGRVSYERLTPGSFMVRIPWDIPGYTDRFDETLDHPRHQIHTLIEKVKAAGVESVIAYEKQFSAEDQGTQDQLWVKRSPFQEIHELVDHDLDFRSQQYLYGQGEDQGIEHEMSDRLVTSATFDYTHFDSLNGFA